MNYYDESTLIKKKDNHMVEYIFLAFMALVSCDNRQTFLYGGYMILMLAAFHNLLFTGTKSKLYFTKELAYLLIFAVYAFLSSMWAWDSSYAFTKCRFIIIAVFMVVVMINYFCKTERVEYILYTIIAIGLALSVYVIFSYGGLTDFYNAATAEDARLGADISNVNGIGMSCSYSVVVLFYYGLFKKKRWCYALTAVPFLVSAASGSRKALLVLVIGVMLVILFYQNNTKGVMKYFKILIGIVVSLLIFRFLLTLDIMQTVNERMETLFESLFGDASRADGSALARQNMVGIGLSQFFETPFFGIGLANSYELNLDKIGVYTYSHNDYIEHLVNGGVVGFCLYYIPVVMLLIKHIKLVLKEKDSLYIISLIILILFVIMNYGHVSYYNSLDTYMYFILWICVLTMAEKKEKEDVKNTDSVE